VRAQLSTEAQHNAYYLRLEVPAVIVVAARVTGRFLQAGQGVHYEAPWPIRVLYPTGAQVG
jgi:hypothetical protein